jgi:hypothetical protein
MQVRTRPVSLDFELTCHSTLRNQTKSPLLRLPDELRNQIFTNVFSVDQIKVTIGGENMSRLYLLWRYHSVWRQPLSLRPMSILSTCRQIYKECLPLPYKLNSFA